jgi:hypothetical protein
MFDVLQFKILRAFNPKRTPPLHRDQSIFGVIVNTRPIQPNHATSHYLDPTVQPTCHILKFLFQNMNHFSLINLNFENDFIWFKLNDFILFHI